MASSYNGRVDIQSATNAKEYVNALKGKNDSCFREEALRGIQSGHKLSDVFFSKENMEALQQGIRYLVWEKSCQKYVIDKQSEDDLRIIMRSVFLQHALNQPYMIIEQVRELNKKVLEFVVPRVMNEIAVYLEYKKRVSTLPEPLARSENTSVAGTKTLELRDF